MDFTTFKNLTVGSKVNLEIDIIARYVARLMKKRQVNMNSVKGSNEHFGAALSSIKK